MKKAGALFLSLVSVLLIGAVLVFAFSGFQPEKNNSEEPIIDYSVKNVIVMIGDGMGPSHIEAAKLYYGLDKLNMETLPYQGLVSTDAIYGLTTDSAAAATALATGKKTLNGMVGMYFDGTTGQNVTEYAMSTGRKTGIVATKPVTDATPACFSVHSVSRSLTAYIAEQQVNAGLNLLMGAGLDSFKSYEHRLLSDGYTFADTPAEFHQANSDKVFALFDGVSPSDEINLEAMTEKALALLNKNNDKGFFAMIEGSKIDSKSHSNEMLPMIEELMSFDRSVKLAIDFVKDNPDTLLIVTADHETGGLTLPEGCTKADISDDLFTQGSHSSTKVRYFAVGNAMRYLPEEIDNTDIAKAVFRALGKTDV